MIAFHPGYYIAECIADKIGIDVDIVLCKKSMREEDFIRVAGFFGTSATLWRKLQTDYDEKTGNTGKSALIERAIQALDDVGKKYPETKIYIEVPGKVAECRISDALIFESQGSEYIAIDAE